MLSRPRRSRSTLAVVLLALVLGTSSVAGTAYGASLTAKQVKKIAAKVVKSKAPTLVVKRARTADTVGGLRPGDLARAGHTHDVQQAFSRQGEDVAEIAAGGRKTPLSIEVSAPDPCGGGTTVHHYLAEGSLVLAGMSGAQGDVLPVAVGMVAAGEEVTFATFDAPFPSAHVRAVHRGLGTFTDTVQTSRVLTLGPGTHTLRLRVHNNSAASINTSFNTILVTHFGHACLGAGRVPAVPSRGPVAVSPEARDEVGRR